MIVLGTLGAPQRRFLRGRRPVAVTDAEAEAILAEALAGLRARRAAGEVIY